MRKDIYVVQKTAEEGKELEDWCIENHIPISSSRFGFDESWKLFAWYQTLQDGFLANQNIKINKQDLTQLTIEEFKRLQLESLGKIETSSTNEDFCENCNGTGTTMIAKLYPNGHTEVNETCKQCDGNGIIKKLSKPEFIVGKWYKSNVASSKDYYIKVKNVRDKNYIEGDCIRTLDTKPYQENSYWDVKESIQDALQRGPLTDLSEIQEYLPDGHIDRQIQTNDKWLIEQAKRLYPIGTKIYQLYSGGTSNKSHEITIHNHDFTIDSDGEVLYNAQYRLYTPINDTWATKVEEQPKYEVVHCKTQEQWDFVKNKIPNSYAMSGEPFHEDCAICILEKSYADLIYWQQQNAKILSFEEWLNKEGITMEEETEYKVGDVIIATGNIEGYKRLKGRIIQINLNNPKGHQYKIDYKEFNLNKSSAIWSDVHELIDEKQNESLVGRWVKTKEGKYLLLTKSGNNGGYYVNYTSDFIDLHFINRPTELKSGYELMPEGFIPTTILEKPSLDFSQLNLEDWLRETKKLNLNKEQLGEHIYCKYGCNISVFKILNGNTPREKVEILWNEWNKPEIDKTDFIVSIPDEWGQNKYVIGIDPYKLLEEEFKPNTQATLIPVKQKQIFKN